MPHLFVFCLFLASFCHRRTHTIFFTVHSNFRLCTGVCPVFFLKGEYEFIPYRVCSDPGPESENRIPCSPLPLVNSRLKTSARLVNAALRILLSRVQKYPRTSKFVFAQETIQHERMYTAVLLYHILPTAAALSVRLPFTL